MHHPLPAAPGSHSASGTLPGALPDAEPGLVLKATQGGQHGLCPVTPRPCPRPWATEGSASRRTVKVWGGRDRVHVEQAVEEATTPAVRATWTRCSFIHRHRTAPCVPSPVLGATRRGHLEGAQPCSTCQGRDQTPAAAGTNCHPVKGLNGMKHGSPHGHTSHRPQAGWGLVPLEAAGQIFLTIPALGPPVLQWPPPPSGLGVPQCPPL